MDYVIETDFQGAGFVAVPNHVARRRGLAPEALGVLVYLASQPRGFIARWSVICEHFGMGKDRWQRIARELRAIGAMDVQEVRGAGGRVIGRRVVVRWPESDVEKVALTESRENPLSDRKPEKPKAGKAAKVSGEIRKSERENPAPYKEEDLDLRALSSKVRDDLRAGRATYLAGVYREPGSPEWKAARAALLSQGAENEGAR